MKKYRLEFCPFLKRVLISTSLMILATGNGWATSLERLSTETTATTQQQRKLTGVVTDDKGESIIGANVIVKGTATGVITDLNGNFSLEVPKGGILQISYIGFTPQEIKITNQTMLKIKLDEDNQSLDEVVVVGYGTQRKGSIATSITSIKSEALQNRATTTIVEALQGQVAGLVITGNSQPGKTPSMQLRGATSLNDGGSPLVLVDGVPGDLNFLNIEDIESINVLKDAASAAIYGSRAANGVILATTKRGKSGKPSFRYNGSIGVNTPTNQPVTYSSATAARVRNEAETNMGRTPVYTPEEIALFENGTDPNRYPNTDWLGLAIQNSITTRHSIEASGGAERVKYLVSAGIDHQTGTIPHNIQNVFNVRSNTDVSLAKKVNLSLDLRYQVRMLDDSGDAPNSYKLLLDMGPDKVAYYTDGTYGYNSGFTINPLATLHEGGNELYNRHDASGILKLDYEIIDGLKFTGIANANYVFSSTSTHRKKITYTDFYTKKEISERSNDLTEKRGDKSYYNLQALLNYKKTFGAHGIDALIGYQQENQIDNSLEAARTDYPTDLLWVLNAGPKDNWSNEGKSEHWAIASVIGRLNYEYANKYILSASFRSDASSRFAKEGRWATFPSVALAWRLSQEKFMQKTSGWLDDLKLRASWGQTGGATALGLYPSYTTIGMDGIVLNGNYIQTAQLKEIGNPELGWERTDMINAAVDFTLFKNRLSVTAEYYVKTSKKNLIALPVPSEYGFGKPKVNIGEMENRGWGLEVRWNDQIKDFKYGISANLSDNENEVLDLGGTGPWIAGYTDIGLPFNSLYGYESLGLFQTDDEVKNAPFQNAKTKKGDVRYKDQNDDNKITSDDRVIIGDPYPHFLYGVTLNAAYKGFDINMLFQGVGSKDRILTELSTAGSQVELLDYWSESNTDAKYPRILRGEDGDHNKQMSDFWKINAGYLRMKNIQIGYTLPARIAKPMGFSYIRAYISASNLFTVSNYLSGWDPEIGSPSSYPFSRTFSFGLNVQF